MLGCAVGSRGKDTGGPFLKQIIRPWVQHYYTDGWEVYPQFLPWDQQVISKTQMYSVEGKNSLIRHFLARFKRKTKCYSKSVHMIVTPSTSCSLSSIIDVF